MILSKLKTLFSLFLIIFSIQGFAQSFKENFIDKEDKALDISGFLNSRAGFLPVPIIITEPAVGYGGGLGLVFFHDKKNNKTRTAGNLPQIMTVVAGTLTENGTWLAIVGHQGSYLKDRIRYTGAIGYVAPKLSFYNTGIFGIERKFNFSMEGLFIFQEFLFRINKKVPFFSGLNYIYFNSNVKFETGIPIPELEELTKETNTGGLNLALSFDKKNNHFTPTKGYFTAFEVGRFDEIFGGENNYWNFTNRTYFYLPIIKDKLFSGFRFNQQSKWGNVPFYGLPFISMRGIPIMRYQGYHVSVFETEWRWQLYKRWSLVGFIGTGFTASDFDKYRIDEGKTAGGGGFRYYLAKDFGMHVGIDVAVGPDDWAWYITIGSNWFR